MGEGEGKSLLPNRGRRRLLFREHSKNIQSLISRLIVKIQLPAQPGLNLHLLQSANRED